MLCHRKEIIVCRMHYGCLVKVGNERWAWEETLGWCFLLWDGIEKRGGLKIAEPPGGVLYLGGGAVVFVDGVVGEVEAKRDAESAVWVRCREG